MEKEEGQVWRDLGYSQKNVSREHWIIDLSKYRVKDLQHIGIVGAKHMRKVKIIFTQVFNTTLAWYSSVCADRMHTN